MEKLLELEKKLKEYREELEKMSSPIDIDGQEIDKSEEKIKVAPENSNNKKSYEKEFEKKESLDKGLGSKLDTAEHKDKVSQALGSIRQPAKVTTAEGEVHEVSPAQQIADKQSAAKQKATSAKVKAEAEAAARRASYKKQGLMKNNQQWTLE